MTACTCRSDFACYVELPVHLQAFKKKCELVVVYFGAFSRIGPFGLIPLLTKRQNLLDK